MKKLILLTLVLGMASSAVAETAQSCGQLIDAGNYKAAVPVCQKAAEQGDAIAQASLGLAYELRLGVEQDDKEAAYWYEKAAKQGNASAQYFLGKLYAKGKGVAQDDKQAFYWTQKAAAQGNASAQTNLGHLYYDGRGVAQDNKQAVEWYEKAAAGYRLEAINGSAYDLYALGELYNERKDGARDPKQAYAWFWVASQWSWDVAEEIAKLEAKLTPEELAEAKALGEKYYKAYASK